MTATGGALAPAARAGAQPLTAVVLAGPDGQPAAVTAIAVHQQGSETSVFAAASSLVHHVDLRAGRVVQTYDSNREEVNGLCVNGRGVHLAAGDDAGEVQVYDLTAGTRSGR